MGIDINLSVNETIKKIEKADLGMSFSITEKRLIKFSEEKKCVILIGEKYYYRLDNYVSVTILINDAGKNTNIDVIFSGGGDGILGSDYGAGEELKEQIIKLFEDYKV